ncbi:MAG TPA: CBS domain-containing protein [Roseiflexaceae bacterium]|nr:CBS domain-containing protein [Roseiflexaceae bacterium]
MRTIDSTPTLQHAGPARQPASDWMHSPVITLNLYAPVSQALAMMREHNLRHLPIVLDTGELCGMITHGDIRGIDMLRAAGLDPSAIAAALAQLKVYEVMGERSIAITPETSLGDAARLMIEHKIGGLPVVDSSGDVVGIVTESDIFRAFAEG